MRCEGGEEMDDAQKLRLRSFLQEQPDWCFDLIACVQHSEELDGTFSGRGVGNRLKRPGRSLVHLVKLGVLVRTGQTSRRGHNAHYRMIDVEGVRSLLIEMEFDPRVRLPGDYFNIGRRSEGVIHLS